MRDILRHRYRKRIDVGQTQHAAELNTPDVPQRSRAMDTAIKTTWNRSAICSAAPVNKRPFPVTPFLVIDGGLFRTRETFFSGTFVSNEGAFTAGGGVRVAVGDLVNIGVDTRVGWELHLRFNAVLGNGSGSNGRIARRER